MLGRIEEHKPRVHKPCLHFTVATLSSYQRIGGLVLVCMVGSPCFSHSSQWKIVYSGNVRVDHIGFLLQFLSSLSFYSFAPEQESGGKVRNEDGGREIKAVSAQRKVSG